MIGPQNLKTGHVTITMTHSGVVCHLRLGHLTVNLRIKFEVPIFTRYEDTKGDAKCTQWGSYGYSRSLKTASFDTIRTSSC